MEKLDKFFDWYHNSVDHGPHNFFNDAYKNFENYETNLGLQTDMLEHANKKIGKFALENPGINPEEIRRELKQKKMEMEKEAFNEPGSHLNGAPQFESMFDKEDIKDSPIIGMDVSELSSRLQQKQNAKDNNRRVMQEFGIPPKQQSEGNNIVNAIERFKMKKSVTIDDLEELIEIFYSNVDSSICDSDLVDTNRVIKSMSNQERSGLLKSEVDDISAELIDITSRIKQKEEAPKKKQDEIKKQDELIDITSRIKQKEEAPKKKQDEIKKRAEHNIAVMDGAKRIDESHRKLEEAKKLLAEKINKMFT